MTPNFDPLAATESKLITERIKGERVAIAAYRRRRTDI